MSGVGQLLQSSIGRKFLMAATGLILAGFVLGHMLGNLQIFLPPETINRYGRQLQTLPYGLLWIVRGGLLFAVVVHIWTAVSLTVENRRARPEKYCVKATVEATYASRTMIWSGAILATFIVFHILHFTVRAFYGLGDLPVIIDGEEAHDVYAMIYLGFSVWYVSVSYIIAMGLLCMHLSHGVSSMFQSIGLRNETWRPFLDRLSVAYGWGVFLGFIAVPVAVLLTQWEVLPLLDAEYVSKFRSAITPATP